MKKAKSQKSSLKAINDIVIVEEDAIETSYDSGVSSTVSDAIKSGKLVIPDAYKNFSEKYPCKGTIVSVGNKCKYALSPGDRIIYARLGVQRYEHNGKMMCDVRECDIHGFIESN